MTTRSEKRRQNHRQVQVRFDEAGAKAAQKNAEAAGLTLASLMRNLALGYQPKSRIDNHRILELVRLKGDLGRMGGLIKLALSTERMTWANKMEIEDLLIQVREKQARIGTVIEALHKDYRRRRF